MIRAILLAVLVATLGLNSARAAPLVRIEEPRAFGYFIGDVLKRDVVIRVADGESLDGASLPRPGPVNYWLELSEANLTTGEVGDQKEYRLSLVYQTFYAPLDPRYLTIPGFTLKVKDAEGASQNVIVPELKFLTSPIRQLFADQSQSSGSATELQPDEPAPRVPTGTLRTVLLLSGVLCALSLTGLAWHNAWWPFRSRPSRPFTDAARYLNSNSASLQDPAGYRLALLKLHRAFDLAAGRRVLADDVDAFLRDHPEFAEHGEDVRRLFASSRQAFFANDVEQARAAMPLRALARLSALLGVAERRTA